MKNMKFTEKESKRPQKEEEIDRVFFKKIENLKESEQRLMLKLYKEILKEIDNENLKTQN